MSSSSSSYDGSFGSGSAISSAADTMLLVVGMQNDKYRPAMIRPSSESCSIVAVPHLLQKVNECIRTARARDWQVVFALDLHHPQHISFDEQHPPHCVLQTWGSSVVNGLEYGFVGSDMVLRGLDKDEDSNDAFYVSQNSAAPPSFSRLRQLLRMPASSTTGVGELKRLALCGASPDGCIERTALTAATAGYCRGDPIIIDDASILPLSSSSPYLVTKPLSELLFLWP